MTGGDSGIGRAVALAYAREGADVAISYLSEHDDAEVSISVQARRLRPHEHGKSNPEILWNVECPCTAKMLPRQALHCSAVEEWCC